MKTQIETYEVVNNFGERLTTGTYMECMSFINEPAQKEKELNIQPLDYSENN